MSLRTGILRQRMTKIGGGGNPWERYVQDGLVFQLDCDTECSATIWKDIKGGLILNGTNVEMVNGVPYFANNANYMVGKLVDNYSGSLFDYPSRLKCIELCAFLDEVTNNADIFNTSSTQIGILNRTPKLISIRNTFPAITPNCKQLPSTQFTMLSVSNEIALMNGEDALPGENNGWSPGSEYATYVGSRNFVGGIKFKAFSIRVYDRYLTREEMLSNQAIDLERFGNR